MAPPPFAPTPGSGPEGQPQKTKDSGTAYLVLAILALLLARVPFIGVLLTVMMVVFGVVLFVRGERGKKLMIGFVCALLGAALAFGGGNDNPKDESASKAPAAAPAAQPDTSAAAAEPAPSPTPTPAAEAPAPVAEAPTPAEDPSPYGTYPQAEADFVATVTGASDQYGAVETDLQRSEVVRNRNATVCSATGGNATDWVGVVSDIGANREGKAWVEIELAPNVRVHTWNNALSDISDETLIDPSEPMFGGLVAMTKDQKVVFSGSFVADDSSCVKTSNMTETFGALDPQFVFKFSDVHAQ
ncbi:hypothetical protein EV386_2531 [Xylanimonas ulmi]|uniref:Uncharacterized protein n=2 Tax=Xylanimonas ulmi TaxID=228973 RepID=A0A4V2EY95_9MICO|nr:hypothetical protein EV386_2531 [Xylanibacterium ulmi]